MGKEGVFLTGNNGCRVSLSPGLKSGYREQGKSLFWGWVALEVAFSRVKVTI